MKTHYLLPVIITCILQLFGYNAATAQNIAINTTGFDPAASAMLDIQSTDRGLLIPQVSLTSLTDGATVSTPAHSLLIYNTNAAMTEGKGYYYNAGTTGSPLWVKLAVTGTFWKPAGNAGTTPGTDFIGTTDARGLMFKTNNIQSGYIDLTGTQNTSYGKESLLAGGGLNNVAIGWNALKVNNMGNSNVAIGSNALVRNKEGQNNIAIGSDALRYDSIGKTNVAVGGSSLYNTLADNNTAVGYISLHGNSTGQGNIGIGNRAGYYNTTASNQVFFNSLDRSNYTGDTTGSPIYIQQNTVVASQRIKLNGKVIMPNLPAGAGTKAVRIDASGNLSVADTASGSTGSGWGLSGNTGTAGTDFIGTTDARDLVIKTNGSSRINISSTGVTTIGDGTNNTKIEADGSLLFEGAATTFGDLTIPLYSTKTGEAGSQPAWVKMKDNGAGSRGVYAYNFAGGTEQEVFFSVQLPHNWKEGSAIYPHVHWSPQTTGQSGTIVWGIEYTWVNYNAASPETFANTTLLTATSVSINGTASAGRHLITAFALLTPDNTQDKISSVLMCRFYRKGGDAADTYNGNAAVMSVDFHYEIDAIGSRTEYIK
jgi:hypothetical protein